MTGYQPPEFHAPIEIDLSRNEGKAPLATIDLDRVGVGRLVSRYPETAPLAELVAARHGVGPEQALVTAGGDDALFRCLLRAGGPVVTTTPSFEMISRYADQAGARLVEVPWWGGDFPISDFLDGEAEMAVIVSPNNPTGSVMSPEDLRKVADRFAHVVLDAAYGEFADEDLTPTALELGNVVVIRTFSKAFGMAGLRVGYLLGSPDLVSSLRGFGSPFAVSGLSAAMAAGVLADGMGTMAEFVARVREERTRLSATLTELGAAPLPSQGNFVLATDVHPTWLAAAAASMGIGLRQFPDRHELGRCVRIGLPGDEVSFSRLTGALRVALAPEAILFTVDAGRPDRRLLERWSRRVRIGLMDGDGTRSRPGVDSIGAVMEQLGVTRAWMVGSEPRDVVAARRAGLVPLLVGEPGEGVSRAGPARVLADVAGLEEVLDAAQV